MRTVILSCLILNLFLFAGSIVAASPQSAGSPSPSSGVIPTCTEKNSGPDCISPPRLISSSPPATYSEEARKAKIEGNCVVSVVVDKKGNPTNLRVIEGLGMGLDEKAIEAVKQWKFAPALKDGKPVVAQIAIQVSFHL